jgi:hypothetical protein
MTENFKAFGDIISNIHLLTALQKQQLFAMLSVELNGSAQALPVSSKVIPSKTAKTQEKSKVEAKPKKKGNPKRKSQYSTNPIYIEYQRLKKVVVAQAKAGKISFNEVKTAEKAEYDLVFIQWVEAKSSFRDRASRKIQGAEAAQSEDELSIRCDEDTGGSSSVKKRKVDDSSNSSSAEPGAITILSGSTTRNSPSSTMLVTST